MRVRARWKPIVAALALGLAGGLAYLALVDEQYDAEAKLQVVPLAPRDRTFAGFALPRTSDGPGAVETLADLVERPPVVETAAVRLRLEREDVLEAVTVHTRRDSNVVVVRAEAGTPRGAAQLANAVAEAFLAERSAVFQGELNREIARLRDELRNVPASQRDVPPADALVTRLDALRASLGERDPTIRLAATAVARDRVVRPRPLPVLATALLGSLVLGLGAAALLAASSARPSPPPTGDGATAEREAALGERVRILTERERTLARRAGELATRERDLDQRAAAAAPEPEPEPEPESEPKPEPVVPPQAPPPERGAWNVVALERLVAERGSEFPERFDEWRSYLFFLRDYALPDGNLPRSFDALVDETFRELVG